MDLIRAFFQRHRALAFMVIAAALCMKALLPAGYMIGETSRTITVQICHDGSGISQSKQIAIPMKGAAADTKGKQGNGECPFSALSMASLSGADTALLAVALAFILALGFAPIRPILPQRQFHLRPPLRGPPAFA